METINADLDDLSILKASTNNEGKPTAEYAMGYKADKKGMER